MELDLRNLPDDIVRDHGRFVRNERPARLPATGGPAPKLSDSEVLCLQGWRPTGAPAYPGRPGGFVRYASKHLRSYFPQMTSQSAFNRRLRRLWGAFIPDPASRGRPVVVCAGLRSHGLCTHTDCPGCTLLHPGWLADIARIGKGGNDRYFYGLHLLLVVSATASQRAGRSRPATFRIAG